MALNLTPDYFEADRKYRQATNPADKLAALEEMLRTIPKHKASEKKQADLKRRISELRGAPQKKKGAGADPYHIPRQGAGQALLLGLPNSGKSSIAAALTNAPVKVTDFPFGTPLPVPGIAHHEDVPIELVDLPPVTPEHVPGGLVNAIRNTDAALMVVDVSAGSVLEEIETLLAILAERDIVFDECDKDDEGGHMRVGPYGLVLCNKADVPGADDNLAVLKELRPESPPLIPVSAKTGKGLRDVLRMLFEQFNVIRIYAKEPSKPADKDRPFILPVGSTVEELARTIHKDIAAHLKFARIWGDHVHDGQQVHGHHVLHDRDIVELHV